MAQESGTAAATTTDDSLVQARIKLAYDAAVNELTREDTTLGNLRNRSNAVLTIAALITSFAAGIGFIQTDPTKGNALPNWAAITLLGLLAVIVVLNVIIMWPIDFDFGPDPRAFLRTSKSPADGPIEREMVAALIESSRLNSRKINGRVKLFQLAVFLLGVEVVVILAASLST
jgi:hypothetical protein